MTRGHGSGPLAVLDEADANVRHAGRVGQGRLRQAAGVTESPESIGGPGRGGHRLKMARHPSDRSRKVQPCRGSSRAAPSHRATEAPRRASPGHCAPRPSCVSGRRDSSACARGSRGAHPHPPPAGAQGHGGEPAARCAGAVRPYVAPPLARAGARDREGGQVGSYGWPAARIWATRWWLTPTRPAIVRMLIAPCR